MSNWNNPQYAAVRCGKLTLEKLKKKRKGERWEELTYKKQDGQSKSDGEQQNVP